MRIFVNYRRADFNGHASMFVGRLFDHLATCFGEDNLFMDVHSTLPGKNFVTEISRAVTKADVLIAVIGPQWVREFRKKRDQKDDFVRIEIQSAMREGIPVIPILAGGAKMPTFSELTFVGASSPSDDSMVEKFLQIHAFEMSEGDEFRSSVLDLIKVLQRHHNELEMVRCEPGTFVMGSPNGGKDEELDLEWWGGGVETQHEVTLTKPFWIAKYPVTQRHWLKVMGGLNPSKFPVVKVPALDGEDPEGRWQCGMDLPVEQVSWYDAMEFCKRLSERENLQYTLPSEAQWEYACRAGTKGAYNLDSASLDKLGWYHGNSVYKTRDDTVVMWGPQAPHPVGQKLPNDWGLYDMHGNIVEWCLDGFVENLGSSSVSDPKGPEITHSLMSRTLRGGCFIELEGECRSARRKAYGPNKRVDQIGFRPVRLVE